MRPPGCSLCCKAPAIRWSLSRKRRTFSCSTPGTVTASGDSRLRHAMRKVRREHPDALLVLTGCYPQAYPDEAAAIPEADLVLGTKHRSRLPGLLAELCQNHARIAAVDSYGAQDDFEALPCDTMPDNTRAFLKIQDGCQLFLQLLHHPLCPWTLPEPAAGGTAESRRRICGERLSGDRPLRHQPGLLRHGVGRLAGRGGGDLCRRPRRGACPAGVSRTGAADGRTAFPAGRRCPSSVPSSICLCKVAVTGLCVP